jgi:hypothetical protein
MIKHILQLCCATLLLFSCNKKTESKEGSIDLFTNIYYNASQGLTNYKQFYISKMDYKNDTIIEFTPNINFPTVMERMVFIKGDKFYKPIDFIEGKNTPFMKITAGQPQNLLKKDFGSKWVDFPVFGYEKRIKMNDTILYGNKEFSRFKTIQDKVLTIFYIKKTDTILPYSLNRIADADYKGRLERIDSYDKGKDIFTTLVLVPRRKMSQDGREAFSFNYKLNKMIKQKEEK